MKSVYIMVTWTNPLKMGCMFFQAKAIMIEWLRAHQENPYPNDDEKEELMASTKLTISQINYWFTNARRRLLPKWAMQRRHAFEREAERHVAIPIQ
jgi:hypothetical protein